jgi:hypothetical protein
MKNFTERLEDCFDLRHFDSLNWPGLIASGWRQFVVGDKAIPPLASNRRFRCRIIDEGLDARIEADILD